jgi:hypothetical protein
MFLEENPSIVKTTFILSPTLQYTFDVNHTVTICTLKKLIAAAARLRKNSFRLFSNQKEYTYYTKENIGMLFPNQQHIIFTIQHSEVEDIDDLSNSTIKVRISSYCNEHETKYLNYYCFTCNTSLCSLCILDPRHKGHDYKEKCDYFQSSKFLVDAAFKQNKNLNFDSDPKKLFNINDLSQFKAHLKNVLFKTLYDMLMNIETKLNEIIDFYNSTSKISCENLQDNYREIKRFCVKGLEQLKERIEIRNILIDENVFLTFHNKYKELASKQEKRIEVQVQQFKELCNVIANPIKTFVNNTYDEIFQVLNKKLNMKEYDNLKRDIKANMITEISESEVIKDIVGENEKKTKTKRPYSTMVQNITESIQNHAEELRRKSDPKLNELLNESNHLNVSSHSIRSSHSNHMQRASIESDKKVNDINMHKVDNPFLINANTNVNVNANNNNNNNITSFKKQQNVYTNPTNPFIGQQQQQQLQLQQQHQHQHQRQRQPLQNNVNPINQLPINNHNHNVYVNKNVNQITTPISMPPTTTQLSTNKVEKNINIQTIKDEKQKQTQIELPHILAPIRQTNEIKILYLDHSTQNKKITFPVFLHPPYFLEKSAHCNYEGKLYISGGIENSQSEKPSSSLLKYDLSNDSLIKLSNLITPRFNHTMKTFGNYIYAVGGRNNKSCERYVVSLNKWERMPDMNYEREKPILEVHEGYLYAFFGKNGNTYSENVERIQLNNPTAKWEEVTFKNEDNLSLKMYGCATFLKENDLFFFGGNVNNENVATICCFDFENMSLVAFEDNLEFKQTFTESQLYLFGNCWAQLSDNYIPVIIDIFEN